ncbi:Transcriptional regulatory protein BtsR [bioreactor metagenome]|jgi:two-component system LytT family response regulator|uniref:Transcriptional regulatory protein BtsR n=1 Tax=bioreactor metagenome TaxID=1076179 RepID=A0A644UF87_9ZZZZ|nr:response regulator [Lentimicrobium sp.]MEA5111097.1 response regulator [Lentimicrobium sp.]
MSKIKVLIIDDEPPARDLVKHYLKDFPALEIAGECENGFEALKAIQELKPQLIFLDIQMPKINGFELLELLTDPPPIIFTTAYDEFAIRAFEMNAVDYLLKPFSASRFRQAVERALLRIEDKGDLTAKPVADLKRQFEQAAGEIDRVVARIGSRIVVIPVDTIYYIEAQDDYVMICSSQGNHLKEKTMKYFESHLPGNGFIRIHRSHIVNISQIVSVDLYGKDTHLVVLKSGARLKASAEGYKRLRELL